MPKIIGASLAEHRAATRRRLCDALARLMQERGFDMLTLADIAAEAGIGRTAVYNHFPDKESVLLAHVNDETARHLEVLTGTLTTIDDPIDKLRVYITRQLQMSQFFHFAPGPSLKQIVSPKTWTDLRDHGIAMDAFLREILREAMDSGVIATQDINAAARIIHSVLTGRPAPSQEPERSAFISATEVFILRGLGTDETHG